MSIARANTRGGTIIMPISLFRFISDETDGVSCRKYINVYLGISGVYE